MPWIEPRLPDDPGDGSCHLPVIVELIAATTTRTGLKVQADLDTGQYPLKQKATDEELAAIPLTRHDWHPDWNCTIAPGPR